MRKDFFKHKLSLLILTFLAAFSPATLLALEFLKITPEDFVKVENARQQQNSPLEKPLMEEQAFRIKSWEYLGGLRDLLMSKIAEKSLSIEEIQQRCLAKIAEDLQVIGLLANAKDATWSFKTHKMREILTETGVFLQTGHNLKNLLGVDWQNFYPIRYDRPLVLGGVIREDQSFEDIQGTQIALCIRATFFMILKIFFPDEDYFSIYPIDKNPLFCSTALPAGLTEPLIEELKRRFTWYYQDNSSPFQGELIYPHQGFGFRGYVDDTRYFCGSLQEGVSKISGPLDCSAWISFAVGSQTPASTYHFLALDNLRRGEGLVKFNDEEDSMIEDLANCIESIEVLSIGDVKAGDVVAFRRFNLEKDPSMLGKGENGHVMLVVAKTDVDLIVLHRARDLPKYCGFGISKIHFTSKEAGTRWMYFRKVAN